MNAPPPLRGPALAICGWSGSGKTTALREVIPVLVERGLAVAALKHDAHGIRVDPAGKDSDELFLAGADVVLRGPDQSLLRLHDDHFGSGLGPGERRGASPGELFAVLQELLVRYDVVLVEGHKETPLRKIWITGENGVGPPADVTGVLAVLPREPDRPTHLLREIDAWLPGAWREPPVYGGILVGGKSRRMGRPKALLELGGRSFLGRAADALTSRTERVVLLGDGPVPEDVTLPRLPDAPGLEGPLAGILGALRWAPDATWLLAGCDQPSVSPEALDWLLDQRAPGRWTILPRLVEKGVEPLLAIYDARARRILEGLAATGCLAPSALATHTRTVSPSPPAELVGAWRNVNTPEDLDRARTSVQEPGTGKTPSA